MLFKSTFFSLLTIGLFDFVRFMLNKLVSLLGLPGPMGLVGPRGNPGPVVSIYSIDSINSKFKISLNLFFVGRNWNNWHARKRGKFFIVSIDYWTEFPT